MKGSDELSETDKSIKENRGNAYKKNNTFKIYKMSYRKNILLVITNTYDPKHKKCRFG